MRVKPVNKSGGYLTGMIDLQEQRISTSWENSLHITFKIDTG